MKPRVYVETSILGYLTSRDSTTLVGAARQLLTRKWWRMRDDFELCVSEVVVRECAAGDPTAASARLAAIDGIALLTLNDQAANIAAALIGTGIMPPKALEDALHVAIASAHQVDFLLSWNFKHIANPVIQAKMAAYLANVGLTLPYICAPEDLLGDGDE